MKKIKNFIFIIFFIFNFKAINAETKGNKILVKIENEIITNFDVKNKNNFIIN